MYCPSPVVAKAITLGIVEPNRVKRLAGRVQRRARDLPSCDLIWIEELLHYRWITPYQAGALLAHVGAERVEHASPQPDSPLEIGPYVVLDRVGCSDLGATYRGRLRGAADRVAIRCLSPGGADPESVAAQLETETGAWRSLEDPCVIATQCLPLPPGPPVLVSAWVEAEPLARLLCAGSRLSCAAALAIWRQLVAVLARADTCGLVHGDLRPSNVLVHPSGRVLVTGCGLRRALKGAALRVARRLPPERYDYVAPQVAYGDTAPDASSDIYALGCLLYHMVTGRAPFPGADAATKCAAHRAGRPCDPRSLGVELAAEVRAVLVGTLEPDALRRIGSYNELLSRIPPSAARPVRSLQAELGRRSAPRWTNLADEPRPPRLPRWAVAAGVVILACTAAFGGRVRLLPLLRLPFAERPGPAARLRPVAPERENAAPTRVPTRALWDATEKLRRAYEKAQPGQTIVLQSPGPYLMDELEILKPIELRGDKGVTPLFLGGPGAGLRITARDVRLENLHFIRLNEALAMRGTARAMIDCQAPRCVVSDCSFQDLGPEPSAAVAIFWRAAEPVGSEPASLECRNLLFRNLACGVSLAPRTAVRLSLIQCMHLGPGPLVRSASLVAGRALDAVDVSLAQVTVYGSTAIEHSFAHPADDMPPLRVATEACLVLPADRQQPVLEVRYAGQPNIPMPRVSWTGARTFCPSDACLLRVWPGPGELAWQLPGITAWNEYWKSRPTGVIGIPVPFASRLEDPAEVPRPRPADGQPVGADPSLLCYPPRISAEQLALFIARLTAR
jgi:hypothetical protein